MATTKSKQALVLQNIAEEGEKLDNVAGAFMKLVKEEKIDSLEKFNPWLEIGYTENGWSSQVGRPGLGVTTLAPAPRAVKQYASMFRAAFKMQLEVLEFETVRQMVDAVAEKRKELTKEAASLELTDPELKGITVKKADRKNGALFHDAIWFFDNLPQEYRDDFAHGLRKLMIKLETKIPKEIRKQAAA
jgi:hypothetical protein